MVESNESNEQNEQDESNESNGNGNESRTPDETESSAAEPSGKAKSKGKKVKTKKKLEQASKAERAATREKHLAMLDKLKAKSAAKKASKTKGKPDKADKKVEKKAAKVAKKAAKKESSGNGGTGKRGRKPIERDLPRGQAQPTIDGEVVRSSWMSRVHGREKAAKDSAILCQRSSKSEIWKRDMVSVPPGREKEISCKRCVRVVNAAK